MNIIYWLEKIAGWKYRVVRLQWYISLISLYMIGRLFIDKYGVKWWYVFIIPIFYFLNWFDKYYGVSKEQGTATSSNPEHNKLFKLVEEINKKLEGKHE